MCYLKIAEKANLLKESVSDNLEQLQTSIDTDAKTGYKTANTSFFGYKTHIAMTEERIITAAIITSGEKTDGKNLALWQKRIKKQESKQKMQSMIKRIKQGKYRDSVGLQLQSNLSLKQYHYTRESSKGKRI